MRITKINLRFVNQVSEMRGGYRMQLFDVQYQDGGYRIMKVMRKACPVWSCGVMREVAL